MPELPEVEQYRRYFERHAVGRTISGVTVRDRGVLAPKTTPASLHAAAKGRRFESVHRHGKNLFAALSGDGVIRVHFGMTGDLAFFKDRSKEPRFARVIFNFRDGGHLAFEDARKFGRVEVIAAADEYLKGRGLGPDPLTRDFDPRQFADSVAKRRGAIKPLLLNQRVLAGVGNLYADEALFQAGIHPLANVNKLSAARLTKLFETMRQVLQKTVAIQSSRDPRYPRRFLLPRREASARCPKCAGRIERATVGGRTTYFCRTHQKR
jgi:formamidopyrimidine-DNA glycosylase